MFIARFDLRAPGASGPARAALHRGAVDMARYVDEHGCASIVVSEHHASDDGYLPAPFQLAAAMAAATSATPIVLALTILPFHDPVRLAEDIITLDHLSEGRSMVVLGLGYRPVEYQLFGVDFRRRAAVADEKLARLLELLDAAHAGVDEVRVTPGPFTMPRPLLAWGGGSVAAARRAGRHGIGFFGQNDGPDLRPAYEAAAREAGHEPGLCVLPSPAAPFAVFVADDVDAGWAEIGPALLVDAVAYHRWNAAAGTADSTASVSSATDVAGLRAANGAHRVVDADGAREVVAEHGLLALHPLCGGVPPETAWPYLRRAVAAIT
ncbi:LLM class flavin-dependent oxidoreductase [Aquihabitans daechungensis]|uniref:LLM class flavin-dependent oxidoreductase n=1 Tax=Aquihabitans daechungensis TaxID=1052257 RepID=UPI003BA1D732